MPRLILVTNEWNDTLTQMLSRYKSVDSGFDREQDSRQFISLHSLKYHVILSLRKLPKWVKVMFFLKFSYLTYAYIVVTMLVLLENWKGRLITLKIEGIGYCGNSEKLRIDQWVNLESRSTVVMNKFAFISSRPEISNRFTRR